MIVYAQGLDQGPHQLMKPGVILFDEFRLEEKFRRGRRLFSDDDDVAVGKSKNFLVDVAVGGAANLKIVKLNFCAPQLRFLKANSGSTTTNTHEIINLYTTNHTCIM